MHIAMFIEMNSLVTMLFIVVLAYGLFYSEKSRNEKLRKVSQLAFYLSIIVSGVWLIYWLSAIEHTKQVGFILAYPIQLILFASILRMASMFYDHFNKR